LRWPSFVLTSLLIVNVDKGASRSFFLPSDDASWVGERVGSDEALLLPAPSDDLTRDSPELLEYADKRLESDPVGEGCCCAGGGRGFLTGRLVIDIGAS
jgi:hypothetical protein